MCMQGHCCKLSVEVTLSDDILRPSLGVARFLYCLRSALLTSKVGSQKGFDILMLTALSKGGSKLTKC